MLLELKIRNYLLIDSLEIQFSSNLNALTGETGAGKTILIDAIGLLLGERSAGSCARKGAKSCEIFGTFDLKNNSLAKDFLNSLSLNPEDDSTLILRREIDLEGKSKSFVNDRQVSLNTLSLLGNFLVDLHGQHEHQLLLKLNEQLELLDRYSGNGSLIKEIENLYLQWKTLLEKKESLLLSEQERAQRLDLFQYQLREIDSSKLQLGEEEEIEKKLPQLKNADKLRQFSDELYSHLYESEGSVLERLQICQGLMHNLETLQGELKDSPSLLEESFLKLNEAANFMQGFRENLNADPEKLDALISRQDLFAKLKKKYGSSIEEILTFAEKIRHEVNILGSYAETLDGVNQEIETIYDELIKKSKKLTALRKKAGEKLSSLVLRELKDLGFSKAQFSVQLTPNINSEGQEIPAAHGLEKIEFLFSANPGEAIKPLKQVASGGELSRIMLALKKVLSECDLVPTLIFDEIDTGIGGSMGHVLGEKLQSLAKTHQILLITHLPQIAAFADRHLLVRKNVRDETTKVVLELLDDKNRVKEVARMLGGILEDGVEPTAISLKHASELLLNAR
ncbi:MAG: DNA repair protein RecN [Elusimicrobia bacterium]|nr:DNA repair protein RecN [Elusimicrobiota bacterium]